MSGLPTHDTILNQLNWRYATKAFDPTKRISDDNWRALSEALRLSPSSYGLQPWRFIVVESAELRQKLASAAPLNRDKFEAASHIVIIAGLEVVTETYVDRHSDRIAAVRNTPRESQQGYRDMVRRRLAGVPEADHIEWTSRQIYIAMGTFLTVAALLNIDSCAMEGIDPAAFDNILGLRGTGYKTVVALAAGYRTAEDMNQHATKVRFDREDVLVTL